MSARANAARLGARRGWHEFVIGLRSSQDQTFYLMMGFGALALLWFNRKEALEGTTLTLPQVALPSLLAGIVMFSIVIGPAYALALEREDGTLLRSRIAPYGLHGYLVGVATLSVMSLLPLMVILLGDVWRIGPGIAVLAAWTVVGCALATLLVRRMSRRQSAAGVAAARDQAANPFVR